MISQTIIKFLLQPNVCYKQYYYWIIEGGELIPDTPLMRLGRYFESNLIGADRNGEVLDAVYNKSGEKQIDYQRVDKLIEFAKGIFEQYKLTPKIVQEEVEHSGLEGHIDFIGNNIKGKGDAIYDVKLTFTAIDDRWNGWADPDLKEDAKIQASHYTLLKYLQTGEWLPFYYLIFGVKKSDESFWCKIYNFKISEDYMNYHKSRILAVSNILKEQMDRWEAKPEFNKCSQCPFRDKCDSKATKPEIETIWLTS